MIDNLITSLFNKIREKPYAMSQIDWIDVEVYCTAWVHGRDEIYRKEDYIPFLDKVHMLCHEIQTEVEAENYTSAMLILAELSGIIEAMPEIDHYRSVIYQSSFDAMMLEHYRKETNVILGDSHVNFFSGNELLNYTPIGNDMHWCRTINSLPITALHVGPGLAYNSCKYETTSKFREKTEFLLKNHLKKGSHLLFTLGEVDCRAHVLKQAELQNRDYHKIVDDISNNYIDFLKFIKGLGFITGCWGPIATQSDKVMIDPRDKKYPRYGSEIMRNMATEYLNNRLRELCHVEDILFLSLFDKLIDSEYKTRSELYSEDGVHLSQKMMPAAMELLKANGYI